MNFQKIFPYVWDDMVLINHIDVCYFGVGPKSKNFGAKLSLLFRNKKIRYDIK